MVKLRNLVQSSDIKILRYYVKFLCVENNTESGLVAISPWSPVHVMQMGIVDI